MSTHLDIVTTDVINNRAYLLQGDGMGGFGAATSYATGSFPNGLAAGDLNKDGFDDIITADYDSNSLTIWYGYAGGLHNSITYILTFSFVGVVSVEIADIVDDPNTTSDDGNLDVITGNLNDNFALLVGNGDGTLNYPAFIPTGFDPFGLVAYDFNDDGFMDVATANSAATNISVHLGDGLGGFTCADYSTGGSNPIWMDIGDFDDNGTMDIVTVNFGSSEASIMLNDGNGVFFVQGTIPTGLNPFSVTVGDFNGDGVARLCHRQLFQQFGHGGVEFSAGRPSPIVGQRRECVGRWTGSGKLDQRRRPVHRAYHGNLLRAAHRVRNH